LPRWRRIDLVRYVLLILAAAVVIPLAAAEADWRSPARTEVPAIELQRDPQVVRVQPRAKATPKPRRRAAPVSRPRSASRATPVRRSPVRARPSPPARARTTQPSRQVGARQVTPRPAPAGGDDDDEAVDGDD
jgi:hypothetical protein